MSFQHRLRLGLRRVGIEAARYPSCDPMFRVSHLLHHLGADCVVDVGANGGGFASTIRRLGYAARIVSLEPLSGLFEVARQPMPQETRPGRSSGLPPGTGMVRSGSTSPATRAPAGPYFRC